ncbi:MAG TPA: ABC transporter substrate-binding protein [Mycobacteriales bacterium]|nr:ABC transporter substrate-binding protein [Mycobacteriales bacterium]
MRSIRTRRLLAAVCAAGVLASLGAACGSGTPAASGGGLLDVYSGASGQLTPNFNPFSLTATAGTAGMIYEPLMFFNQARANDIQPQLATRYSFADGGRTLNFTLRRGVRWSDGQPFTAADVAFTFNLIRTNQKLNTQAFSITNATAGDATHVTLTFSRAVYTRLWNIAGQTWIVPEHIWSKISDPANFTNSKPVGTGPFTLASFSPQSYVLRKNTKYWEAGKPKIAGLRFHSFSGNESATTALAAGQLDWSGLFIPNIAKQYVSKDSRHNQFINESILYVTNLVPNLDRPPLNDVVVRKAISAALDRNQIIKLAFSGYGKYPNPAEIVQPLYTGSTAPKYRGAKLDFDPKGARQSLLAAGYTAGSDGILRDPRGRKLSFTCKVVSGFTDYISALQIITQSLRAIGIELKTQQVSNSAFATAEQTGDFDFIITNGFGGPSPFFMYNNLLSSKQTAPVGQPANSNFARFRNATVDQALATIQSTPPTDTATLNAAYRRIQDVVVSQLPYIPIQQSSSLAEYRTVKATGWPTASNHYALALPYSSPDAGIVAKNLVPVH